MNVIARPQQTITEFLAWERNQELAYEFDGVRAVPMNGGTIAHYLIAANLLMLLRSLLDEDRFRLVPSGVKVIAAGHVRYPDLVIARQFNDTTVDIVPEPVVVVEVVSPSSRTLDTVVKTTEYRDTPSIQQYVILEQDAVSATVWRRRDGGWVGALVTGEMTLDIPELGVGIVLADVYEGVSGLG